MELDTIKALAAVRQPVRPARIPYTNSELKILIPALRAKMEMPELPEGRIGNLLEANASYRALDEMHLAATGEHFDTSATMESVAASQPLPARAAIPIAATPPASLPTPATSTASSKLPSGAMSLATLREFSEHVFGLSCREGSEKFHRERITKICYERNLRVPGLDYSALESTGAFREKLFGANRTTTAMLQLKVANFFAQNCTTTTTANPNNLTGRARFIAAVRVGNK